MHSRCHEIECRPELNAVSTVTHAEATRNGPGTNTGHYAHPSTPINMKLRQEQLAMAELQLT